MTIQKYSHPKSIQWFKNIFAVLAFIYPPYMILTTFLRETPKNALSAIIIIVVASFMMIPILVAAYFFQDVWVDDDGLIIEFLRRKIKVRWVDVIEAKPAWGFLGLAKNRPLIVLVNGLTPFHRILGFLYGWSIKPGFVVFSTTANFQVLKEIIQDRMKLANKERPQ